MKKFKVVLIAAAILFGTHVSAQNSPLTFGVRAGVNFSGIWGDVEELDADSKVGFQVGVTMDMPLTPALYLMTGLHLTTTGFKFDAGEVLNVSLEGTTNLMYLQLPIHLGYKFEVGNGTRLVFHGGPYVAYGVGGNTSVGVGIARVSVPSFEGNEEMDGFNRFDFGVGAGFGIEFSRMTVGLGFDLGLANIHPDSGDDSVRNWNSHLTVGWRF